MFLLYDRPFLHVRNLEENLLFSTSVNLTKTLHIQVNQKKQYTWLLTINQKHPEFFFILMLRYLFLEDRDLRGRSSVPTEKTV